MYRLTDTHASDGACPGASFASQYLPSQCATLLSDVIRLLVCSSITPVQHALKLFIRPCVEVDRLYSTDMRSHAAMYPRASDRLVSMGVCFLQGVMPYRMQTKIPRFQEAHRGSVALKSVRHSVRFRSRKILRINRRLFRLQSAHCLFVSSLSKLLMVCWF